MGANPLGPGRFAGQSTVASWSRLSRPLHRRVRVRYCGSMSLNPPRQSTMDRRSTVAREGWDRRQFLAMIAGCAGAVLLTDCGTGSGAAKPSADSEDVWMFRSRPDLTPVKLDVESLGSTIANGFVLLTPGGPLIADERGHPVWTRHVPHAATNLRVQELHGQPVLTWWEGEIAHYGVGLNGTTVILDHHYEEVARIQTQNGLNADLHAFNIAPDGVAYLTAYREIPADLRAVGGPKTGTMLDAVVQGIDVSSGMLVFEWHSSEHIGIDESYQKFSKKAPFDPVHVNSINVTPDGELLISARNTWTVYKIERSTGTILWRLGGKKNNFSRGQGVHFAWQHDARLHPNKVLTLFDDESAPSEAPESRALMLSVDEQLMRADLIRAFTHPRRNLLANSQGSVQILPDGDVFVGWGAEPYFSEFHPNGTLVLDGHIRQGESYRAFRSPWMGSPTNPPDIAAEKSEAGRMTVYASWNGSTEVANWEVLGGPGWNNLDSIHTSDRLGFETAMRMPVPRGVRYVAVRARGASGEIMGRSRSVPV